MNKNRRAYFIASAHEMHRRARAARQAGHSKVADFFAALAECDRRIAAGAAS